MLLHAIFNPMLLWALFISDSWGHCSYRVLEYVKPEFPKNKLYLPKTSFGSYFS